MTFSRDVILQALASGLMVGGVFALISIGLTLIWGVMKIINFAQGEFLMIGLYLTYFLVTWGAHQPVPHHADHRAGAVPHRGRASSGSRSARSSRTRR